MSALTWRVQEDTFGFMPKGRYPSPKNSKAAPAAALAASSLPETTDRIDLRIDARSPGLFDEVADILGTTRTESMEDSARRDAIEVLLLDQRVFRPDAERFDAFVRMLDDPPAPGPKLRSLLRRVPAWGK